MMLTLIMISFQPLNNILELHIRYLHSVQMLKKEETFDEVFISRTLSDLKTKVFEKAEKPSLQTKVKCKLYYNEKSFIAAPLLRLTLFCDRSGLWPGMRVGWGYGDTVTPEV